MHTSYVSLAVFAMGAAAVPNMPKTPSNPFEGSFPFMPSGASTGDDDGMSNPVPAYMAAMQTVEEVQTGSYSNNNNKPAPIAQPVQAKPASDDNQEFNAPMALPSAPSMNDLIPESLEDAAPSSLSSVNAQVKPSPAFSAVYEYSSSMSIMVSVPSASSSMAPLVILATPAPESMPVEMAPVTVNPVSVQSIVQTPVATLSSFITRPILKAPVTSIVVPKIEAHSAEIHEQHIVSQIASSSVLHAAASSSATATASADAVEDATNVLSKIPLLGGLLGGLGL
ncbi:hypothetical protein PMG11_07491 [Penicillium brasilianum]|uniref:GPI anchored protein n=1 Tax=Penicillium brasilianum TaxID=104259 RepID=A0A0F7TTX7_PENBI|nr:hypothetical protein PMG11_07491 [Penicillium brasilianum]